MTYNTKVEIQTYKIVELLGETAWGRKTMEGVRAAIFKILVEIDRAYEEEGR